VQIAQRYERLRWQRLVPRWNRLTPHWRRQKRSSRFEHARFYVFPHWKFQLAWLRVFSARVESALEFESTSGSWYRRRDTNGNPTRDLPACSAVPQPTTPSRSNPSPPPPSSRNTLLNIGWVLRGGKCVLGTSETRKMINYGKLWHHRNYAGLLWSQRSNVCPSVHSTNWNISVQGMGVGVWIVPTDILDEKDNVNRSVFY
jgi:hypothetical protein